MTESAARKLWTLFTAFLLVFSVLAWIRCTGQETSTDQWGILQMRPAEVPQLALPIDLLAYTLTILLTFFWARDVGGTTWAARLPVFFLEQREINPLHRGGRVYQGASLLVFLVVPLVAILIVYSKFFDAEIYFSVTAKPDRLATGITGWSLFDGALLRKMAGDRQGIFLYGSAHGPQYFLIEPWVYSIWLLGLGVAILLTFNRVFRS